MKLIPHVLALVGFLCGQVLALEANTPGIDFGLADLAGQFHALNQNDTRRARAFVFVGTECPVSNAATPTLNALHDQLSDKADVFAVVSDRSLTRAAAAKHFMEFKAVFPVLFDASGLLAEVLRPTHVPEVFVLSHDGQLIYRGAIDNAFEDMGRRRANVEHHYLRDALVAAVDGKAPAVAATQPVGCLFEAAPNAADAKVATVTYTRDIAPIVNARCVTCHRDGEAAPFALTNYAQTAKRAKQLVRVTQERVMPPWIPAPGHTKFVGERWLTERELTLLQSWADNGRAEGDAADLPAAPQFADGWRFGKPDLILRMSESFTVPADGADILQNFVIPADIAEDKLVAAVEFHPGNKRVVHHAVLFLDDRHQARKLDAATPEPGYANFGGPGFLPSGALGGWSVGNTARALPNDMGRYLKKGSDLVMQLHYHPTGKAERDQSEVGLYFVKRPVAEVLKEKAKLVGSIWMANYEIDIAAGDASYRRTASYTLPREVIMVGVVPHMHLLGKSMTVTATQPDGTQRTLIKVPRWNYNWQDEYYFERPFKLPAGTRLDIAAVFDNSAGNPSNPNSPPKQVTWGDGTLDEMMFCFFLVTAEKTDDLIHTVFHNLEHDMKQPRVR